MLPEYAEELEKSLDIEEIDSPVDCPEGVEEHYEPVTDEQNDVPIDEEGVYVGSTEEVLDKGLDTIAFYKSFRYMKKKPYPGKWGIFFLKDKFNELVCDIADESGVSPVVAKPVMERFVRAHEIYHHFVDCLCLEFESYVERSIYRTYKNQASSKSISEWWEEGMANEFGFKVVKEERRDLVSSIENLITRSPGAYSLINKPFVKENLAKEIWGPRWNSPVASKSRLYTTTVKLRLAPSRAREVRIRPFGSVNDWGHISLPVKDKCPIHWLDRVKRDVPLHVTDPLINEKIDVLKTKFIPKYLAGIKKRETDHEYYEIDNKAIIKTPGKHAKDLRYDEMKNILRKAGMTIKEYSLERIRTNKWKKYVPRTEIKDPR